MEVELECYICHKSFIVKDFSAGISVLDALYCPECLKESGKTAKENTDG